MVQLPAELWVHIATYLSPADLQNAFATHPVFLDLYLTQRYKSLVVASTFGFKSGSLYPRIAAKVTQLVVKEDPPVQYSTPYTAGPPPTQKWRLPVYYIRKRLGAAARHFGARRNQRMESTYFEKLHQSIPTLQNVHSLDVTITSWGGIGFDRHLEKKMQFFSAWSTCWTANLTHVSFACDLFLIHPHWPKDVVFPNLSSLIVKLYLSLEHKEEILANFLRPLIVKHSGSLLTLGLIEETGSNCECISSLLEEHVVLPKLEKLIIGKNVTGLFTESETQQVRHFMKRCSRTLKELNCIMYSNHSTNSIYGHLNTNGDSILDHDFPNIQSLTLSSHGARSDRWDNNLAISYAKRPQSQLRSLTLKTMILSRHAVVTELFAPEALSGTFAKLTFLSFPMMCLDVELLAFLAASLNQLEYLSIRLYRDIRGPACRGDIRHPAFSPGVDTTEFCSALSSLDSTNLSFFSAWKVQELDLIPFFCNTQLDPPARRALVKALPNVQTFCHLGREEYAEVEIDPGEALSRQLNYFRIEMDS